MTGIFVPEGQHDRIAILAPGPSLAKWQALRVQSSGIFTICVGDTWAWYDEANILYHADRRWWEAHKFVPKFYGQYKVSIEECDQPDIKMILRSEKSKVIDLTSSTVAGGGSSGYQAVGLALHYQPKEIILCGFDYKRGLNGKYNISNGHPPSIPMSRDSTLQTMTTRFKPLAEALASMNILVYNCTIDTALDCFPRRELTDVL